MADYDTSVRYGFQGVYDVGMPYYDSDGFLHYSATKHFGQPFANIGPPLHVTDANWKGTSGNRRFFAPLHRFIRLMYAWNTFEAMVGPLGVREIGRIEYGDGSGTIFLG